MWKGSDVQDATIMTIGPTRMALVAQLQGCAVDDEIV